jgi:hypothetical protein
LLAETKSFTHFVDKRTTGSALKRVLSETIGVRLRKQPVEVVADLSFKGAAIHNLSTERFRAPEYDTNPIAV